VLLAGWIPAVVAVGGVVVVLRLLLVVAVVMEGVVEEVGEVGEVEEEEVLAVEEVGLVLCVSLGVQTLSVLRRWRTIILRWGSCGSRRRKGGRKWSSFLCLFFFTD
jgi:hypothetical protein